MKSCKLVLTFILMLIMCASLFACTFVIEAPDGSQDPPKDGETDNTDKALGDKEDGKTDEPTTDNEIKQLLKIDGHNITEYVIVTNRGIADLRIAAEELKAFIHEKTGASLIIAYAAEEGQRAIYFGEADRATLNGYRVKVEDGDLYISCAYSAITVSATEEFIATELKDIEKGIDLPANYTYTYTIPQRIIKYSDFGAVGDGVTDDYAAIKAAHDEANKFGYAVEGDAGATYLIGALGLPSVIIKTDTDWKGAKFIIDDRAIKTTLSPSKGTPLFRIEPDLKELSIPATELPALSKGAENLGYAPGKDCLVYIQYHGATHYIRYGANANSGAPQQEILLVKADGSIDKDTRPIWDYPTVDGIWAVPVNEVPITVQNGEFKTLANEINPDEYISVDRGIVINRSNTTLKNIKHTVRQIQSYRAAYAGFFRVSKSNNVLIYNCEIFCHKDSYFKHHETGQNVLLGSYELSASHSNNVYYDKVIQTNFFDVENKVVHNQGLMGTNYCKNMHVLNSRFARFDAHCQVYNLTVRNSDLQRVNTIGFGTVRIEDTNIWGNYLADLRSDYGGLFGGDYYLKNVTMKYSGSGRISLFSGSWANHFFGYTVVQPQNVYVDNLKVENGGVIYLYTSGLDNRPDLTAPYVNGKKNLNPIVPTKLIEVTSNPCGTVFKINEGPTFKNTVLKLP